MSSIPNTDEDQAGFEQLYKLMTTLRRLKVITDWHHGMLSGRAERQTMMGQQLKQVSVILPLISAAYLNSEYYTSELEWSLQRCNTDKLFRLEAGHSRELVTTVKDLRYLARKTRLKKTHAVENDLLQAEQQAPSDTALRLLKHSYIQMSHLLNQCSSYVEVATALHSPAPHLRGALMPSLPVPPGSPRYSRRGTMRLPPSRNGVLAMRRGIAS